MKRFSIVLLTAILLLVFVPAAFAQTNSPLPTVAPTATPEPPMPEPSPIEDITTDLESLPNYVGLGSLVALVVVVMKLLKLPDGYGGYAALGVGFFAYAMSLALPEVPREKLFEALEHASRLLLVILGSQVTHYSLKYAKADRLWKGKEGD